MKGVVWDQGTLPPLVLGPSQMPVRIVSVTILNHRWVECNCSQHNSRKWKNCLFIHYQMYLLMVAFVIQSYLFTYVYLMHLLQSSTMASFRALQCSLRKLLSVGGWYMLVKMFTLLSPSKILKHSFFIWSDSTVTIVLVCTSSSQSGGEKNPSMYNFMSPNFSPCMKSSYICMSSCDGSSCTFRVFASVQSLLYMP